MEALASGCRIVVSSEAYCPVQTYFGGLLDRSVFTCDPYDPTSIRAALDRALASRVEDDIGAWAEKFSWKAAARQTYEAYKELTRKPE